MKVCATLTRPGASRSTLILLRIPRELRDAVYEQAFELLELPDLVVSRRSRSTASHGQQFPGIVPPFCYTNRQIYVESVPILLHNRRCTSKVKPG